MVNIITLLLFIIAWFIAMIILEVVKGYIHKKQSEALIDAVFVRITRQSIALIRDVRGVIRNDKM